MFKALIGDVFSSRAQTLVNTVNCVGVMGKGIALEFKKRCPEMFEDYAARCAREQVKLGQPYLYLDRSGARIVNFPTKSHWRAACILLELVFGALDCRGIQLNYVETITASAEILDSTTKFLARGPLALATIGVQFFP
jgi:hypothetical protein